MKRRRLELKAERLSKDASQSVLEGVTYRSKVGLDDAEADLEDIDVVPLKPSPEISSLMYFDLETTGFQRTSDIVQIAAICGEKSLNIHMKPSKRISEGASQVTGLTFESGILKRHGHPVESVSAEDGLRHFTQFVASCAKPFLIGHNIQNFDVPVLMHNLQRYDMLKNFQNEISGFIDTYKLSKKVFDKSSVSNFKQETLVKSILGLDYDAHNAMSDVSSLKQLYEKKLAVECDSSDVFSLAYYDVKSSLEPLVCKKVISALMCKRLVSCSLSMNKLKLIHKRDPHNGIRNVFSESVSGSKKARITKSTNVINKVVDFLNSC